MSDQAVSHVLTGKTAENERGARSPASSREEASIRGEAASVVEFTIPSSEFVLRETLAAFDDLELEAERVVAHDERIAPLVRARSSTADGEAVAAAVRDDSSVADVEVLADLDDECLFRMKWTQQTEALLRMLVAEEGVVRSLTGSASRDRWDVSVLFPERAAVSRTHEFCEKAGLTLTTKRIYSLDEGTESQFGLTHEQQEALVAGVEQGYFDVPRRATAKELSDALGISHQALSERFRRGHKTMIESALAVDREPESTD
jgi:predicted DNA binding protein